MHTPVLLQEVIEALNVKPGGSYIDATVGEGGLLKELVRRGGKVLGIDWDREQIQHAMFNLKNNVKESDIVFTHGNFSDIEEIAKKHHFFPVDGIIFDLGLSMNQIRSSGKGFSYKKESDMLDMRLDPTQQKATAAEIINHSSAEQLYEIYTRFSEEINSRSIADTIVRTRTVKPIKFVGDLTAVIDKVLGRNDEKTYARIFQALRIAVNNEFENLKKGLKGALHLIKYEGIIVVISFHSLEDRIVKRFIKEHGLCSKKEKSTAFRKRAFFERSATLRVINKCL